MIERLAVGREDARAIARHVRSYLPPRAAIHEVVAGIVASVEEGGDQALRMHERRFGSGDGSCVVRAVVKPSVGVYTAFVLGYPDGRFSRCR
jgi:hypothetical protein